MKSTTAKLYVLAIVSLVLSVAGIAQNKTDEEAVRGIYSCYRIPHADRSTETL
jgi:hypothetical protein